MNPSTFPNRTEAGRALAGALAHYADNPEAIVLALPRGGVPVAFEVAHALRAPLDVFLVRKLGVPQYEELAMGAIATGGTRVVNQTIIRQLGISQEQIEDVTHHEQRELERREQAFRDALPPLHAEGHICILVDDGLATGSTMRAAVTALKEQHPRKIVVAVPVAAQETCAQLEEIADEVVCLYTPEPFMAVGRWYDDFSQLTDDEVRTYLETAAHELAH